MNPVYVAPNKRMLIFGVDRIVFIAALIGSALIVAAAKSFLAGAVVFGAVFWVSRWLTKDDVKLRSVIWERFKLSSLYDSGR
jgi:type IV secretory pathway TrbD component